MILLISLATCLLHCSNTLSVNVQSLTEKELKTKLIFHDSISHEASLNITQVITNYGYPCQEIYVTTEDGYILGLQRIPHGKNNTNETEGRPVVYLQHGLVDSAHTWVNNLPNDSLGFLLADAGYDVWLANSRGNTYSRRHVSLDPSDSKFWEFSWDEMARYDLPASINKVLSVTGAKKIFYVGHSQGTSVAFTEFNLNQTLASRIAAFIALAPVSKLGNMNSTFLRYAAHLTNTIELANRVFGHGEFFPASWLTKFVAKFLCAKLPIPKVCDNLIFMLAGHDTKNMNETRLPIYGAHTPAGTSSRNMAHYSQAYLQDKFQMFDFGKEENMKRYQQPTPPQYNVSNLHIPTAVFWGGQDWLADAIDAQWLIAQLPNLVHNRYIDYYNHMDFVWGIDMEKVIYPEILKVMQDYNKF